MKWRKWFNATLGATLLASVVLSGCSADEAGGPEGGKIGGIGKNLVLFS